MAAGTFMVAGQRVRTSSTRRYVAWVIWRDANGVETARGVWKRSDNIATIRRETSGYRQGRSFVVIDTSTGEEV